ncbi:hypothetical protein F1880_000764 [Penicillium rolfsii]|nr:hypothetical protein F1880_000764 [Penicillium rolfsii]
MEKILKKNEQTLGTNIMDKIRDSEPPHFIPHKLSGLPNARPNIAYDSRNVMSKHQSTHNLDVPCSPDYIPMFLVIGHWENILKPWELNPFQSLKDGGYHVACMAPRGDLFAPTVAELRLTEYGFLEPPEMTKMVGGKEDGWPEEEIIIWERKAVDYDEAAIRSAEKWLDPPPNDTPWILFLLLLFSHYPFTVEESFFSMDKCEAMPIPSSHEPKTGYEPQHMQMIRDHGLWDKAITMFFTDHGEYLGDHGLIEKWPSGLSETLVREPLIIGGGGIPFGLLPHNSKSLLPIILKDKPHREFAFSEGGFLLSEGRLLELYELAELYDRSTDPLELHNLAADPRFVHQARFMEDQMFRWMVETSDFLPYAQDGRFPKVDLPDSQALWEKRKEKRDNGPHEL